MMLKGTPVKNRDARWHKKHQKKLAKDKARHKKGKTLRRNDGMPISMEQAEKEFKAAQLKEKGIKLSLIKSMWLRLIRLIKKLWQTN